MANDTIQVTERMARFVDWAGEKGQEAVTAMIRERLAELKKFNEKKPGVRDEDGFKWDDCLEPNDGNDQWKHGGDCNLCRKLKYCGRKCRANRLLKIITTPFLYQKFLEEHPETAAEALSETIADEMKEAKELGAPITPDDVLKMVGADGEEEHES